MKKFFSIFLVVAMVITLAACSANYSPSKLLDKEGVAPYELTKRESELLQYFGMENSSKVISFNAPQEAITMEVNAYRLKDGTKWENIGGSAISIGEERIPIKQLSGLFTMQLKKDYTIDFNINCGGRASFTTNEIDVDSEITSSTKGFLTEFEKIEMNKEIPVAIMVYYSGTSMQSYSPQDYFDLKTFEGMDLVQVVTLTFTNKEF